MNKTALILVISCITTMPSLKAMDDSENEEAIYADFSQFQEESESQQNQEESPLNKVITSRAPGDKKKKKSSTLRNFLKKKNNDERKQNTKKTIWDKFDELEELLKKKNDQTISLGEVKQIMNKRDQTIDSFAFYTNDLNSVNEQEETPLDVSLRLALTYHDPKLTITLLNLGADPDTKNNDGKATFRQLVNTKLTTLQKIKDHLDTTEQK